MTAKGAAGIDEVLGAYDFSRCSTIAVIGGAAGICSARFWTRDLRGRHLVRFEPSADPKLSRV
ncbi:MAG: hypothetical protein M3N32_10780 [Actinomycetota bacterium]|nr:hypothetical protein [Actinomycetota bacterium]